MSMEDYRKAYRQGKLGISEPVAPGTEADS